MKKLVTLGLGMLLVARLALADPPIYAPQSLNTTATCAGSAATNIAAVINCQKQASVGLQITVRSDGSDTAAKIIAYSLSVDGTTYESAPAYRLISVTSAGNTAVTVVTNIPTYGAGFIKLHYLTNAAASAACTNIFLQYGVKIGAP